MGRPATVGTCLRTLVEMAIPHCREAERQCPRTGRGRPPTIPDWVLAVLIMVGVPKRKKSKSAQYRFLQEHRCDQHRCDLGAWLGTRTFPARSTYFERYRKAHRVFQKALQLKGQQALQEGLADPTIAAVDKSLIEALGPQWHKKDSEAGRIPAGLSGVDQESTWGYSKHDGWVQGYSYEVVAAAPTEVAEAVRQAKGFRAPKLRRRRFAPLGFLCVLCVSVVRSFGCGSAALGLTFFELVFQRRQRPHLQHADRAGAAAHALRHLLSRKLLKDAQQQYLLVIVR
jgi:hypothetical protein